MSDPLADIVTLLRPFAVTTKLVSGAGQWAVRRDEFGAPYYCVIMSGTPRLAVDGYEPLSLSPGDFVLIPAAYGFDMSGKGEAADAALNPFHVTILPGEIRHGDPDAPANTTLVVGHFDFAAPDAALLVSLLPRLIHVRGHDALSTLVGLVADEARRQLPGRETVLSRLVDVIMIEALRSADVAAAPGLVRALADPGLAASIRCMHAAPDRAWTIAMLAGEAAMSRSSFFEKFSRAAGIAPMEYLLSWRMALARNLLRRSEQDLEEIARQVGYGSASAFTTAFTRVEGISPRKFARLENPADHREAASAA